jgi:hypothetical protein
MQRISVIAKGMRPSTRRVAAFPIAAILAAALLTACAAPRGSANPSAPSGTPNPHATAQSQAQSAESAPVLSRLYFGLASSQGPVSPADFEAFLDTCVTPRFPLGLTRYQADGQWRGKNGRLLKEKSMVVEIIRDGDAASAAKIREIIRLYKARFAQEAVLLVEERPTVEF